MLILTMNEYESMKIAELENKFYNRLKNQIARRYGEVIAKNLLAKFADLTVKQLSLNSMFDVISCFTII